MNKILYITLFISFYSISGIFCQKTDTSIVISAVTINPLNLLPQEALIDTSLFETHFYNPAFINNTSVSFLGNTGLAFITNNFFDRQKYQPFIFHTSFSQYFHDPCNTRHYNTRKPFTELFYVSSGTRANSEQILNALHTQNVNPNINIGVDYNAISSKGIYLNQDSRANRLSLFGSYDKENYSLFASIHTNKLIYDENGGLKNTGDFLEHIINDPLAYDMNLSDANSLVKKTSFFLTQSFKNISANKDTTDTIPGLIPKGIAINHSVNYSRFTRTYTDHIPSGDTVHFYRNNYYLIDAAYDSSFMQIFENSVYLSVKNNKENMLILAGLKHQLQSFSYLYPLNSQMVINDVETDTIIGALHKKKFNNLSLTGNISINTKNIQTHINAEYFLTGFRQNDFFTNILLNKTLTRINTVIGAGGTFSLFEPDYYLQNYQSSHFTWNNNYDKSLNANAFIFLQSENGMIYADVKAGLLNNFVYFNTSAIPEIKENNIYVVAFTLKKKFRWGNFHHYHDLLIQKASDNTCIHLPVFAYRNSTFYEQPLFKKALLIQGGFDIMYNTSFYSDTYMPATGIFYLQDTMETGNYPFLDAFINWKIKRTRFFLKYTNILTGIAGYNYFTSYSYPMNERSLKFGLAWTFYD